MQDNTRFFSDQDQSNYPGRNLDFMGQRDLHLPEDKNSTEAHPQVLNAENHVEDQPNEPQIHAQGVQRPSRVSNFIMPNMIREVKKCLSNAFPGPDNRTTIKLFERMFEKFEIKYQVWAFDAVLVCLIFIRDRTKLVSQKKYTATIEAISSTLEKYKHKSLANEAFEERQLQLIKTQYDLCIEHLKFYDREELNFDEICRSKDDFREEFFSRMLTTRKQLRFKFMRIIENIQICLGGKKVLQELMKE